VPSDTGHRGAPRDAGGGGTSGLADSDEGSEEEGREEDPDGDCDAGATRNAAADTGSSDTRCPDSGSRKTDFCHSRSSRGGRRSHATPDDGTDRSSAHSCSRGRRGRTGRADVNSLGASGHTHGRASAADPIAAADAPASAADSIAAADAPAPAADSIAAADRDLSGGGCGRRGRRGARRHRFAEADRQTARRDLRSTGPADTAPEAGNSDRRRRDARGSDGLLDADELAHAHADHNADAYRHGHSDSRKTDPSPAADRVAAPDLSAPTVRCGSETGAPDADAQARGVLRGRHSDAVHDAARVRDAALGTGISRLRDHFREALRLSPAAAYRDWFRAQEELREGGDPDAARALADDLWESLRGLAFESPDARARFFHNAGVFFGSPGPASDLERARACFREALDHFQGHSEDGWRARALHNLATSMANLGRTVPELEEAIGLFGDALAWRTPEREIARAVSLHNLGLALRRLAELDAAPAAPDRLRRSASALAEAVSIRERLTLPEGLAASRRELQETLSRL